MPSQDLAEALTEAVNAALADMESKYPTLPIAAIDPAALKAELAQAHEDGIRRCGATPIRSPTRFPGLAGKAGP